MRKLWQIHKKTIIALLALVVVLGALLLFSGESSTTEFKYKFY